MGVTCRLANPGPHPNPPYLPLTHQSNISLTYIIPGPVTRQPGTVPMPQSLPELYKLANPEWFTLPFPWEPPKRLWPGSSPGSCLLPPGHPDTSPRALYDMACLLLGNISHNFFFQWHWLLHVVTQSFSYKSNPRYNFITPTH